MRPVVLLLAFLWLPACRAQGNGSRVGFSVEGAGANQTLDGLAQRLADQGWPVSGLEGNETLVLTPDALAGNGPPVNCTATPNATDCQHEEGGMAWYIILVIVLASVGGAAGLGYLAWWLYSKYGPKAKGYEALAPPTGRRVICVQLVSQMCPPEPT